MVVPTYFSKYSTSKLVFKNLFFVLYNLMLLEIFKARKFGMGFFGGVKFWSWDFFGVLLKVLGIYLGFDFCPQPRHKSGVPFLGL